MAIDFNRVPDINDVKAAAQRLAGIVTTTPLVENPLLNQSLGKRLLVKAENLQVTGAFKFRGAWAAISSLTDAERQRGILAYSSGNHAQAIACAAARYKIKATIVMPKDAPEVKRQNTERYGAEIVLYDRNGGEDREAIGQSLAEQYGCVLIKPYDNTQVIAGQGTCGLELVQQAKALNIADAQVLVCCGGGGLTSGIALAVASEAPQFTVHPVEPEHYDDVKKSLLTGERQSISTDKTSICDAIVTPSPGKLTFPILKKYCGNGISVSDSETLQAMKVAASAFKLVAEPGGAVALAAALYKTDLIDSENVICVVSGGNVDTSMLAHACES